MGADEYRPDPTAVQVATISTSASTLEPHEAGAELHVGELAAAIMVFVTDLRQGPRRDLTARRFSSNAEADRHDAEFWRQMPQSERVLLAWRLSVEQWELLGRAPDESGLCRSVASVRRP